MYIRKHIIILAACSILLDAGTTLFAQMDHDDLDTHVEFDPAETTRDRKSAGFFHQATMPTPQAQLTYAREQEKANKIGNAVSACQDLVHSWHDTPQAVEAQLLCAKLLEGAGKYHKAFKEYQYLFDHYQGLFSSTNVLDRQFRIANHIMTRKHSFLFIFPYKAPEHALPLFQKIVKNGPKWQLTAQSRFLIGTIQEELGDLDEASSSYDDVMYLHRNNPLAEQACFRRADCLYKLAKKGMRDEELCRKTVSELTACLRDYPDSSESELVQTRKDELYEHLANMYYQRAVYYDEIARRPKSALIAYSDFLGRFPSSNKAAAANRRINELSSITVDVDKPKRKK